MRILSSKDSEQKCMGNTPVRFIYFFVIEQTRILQGSLALFFWWSTLSPFFFDIEKSKTTYLFLHLPAGTRRPLFSSPFGPQKFSVLYDQKPKKIKRSNVSDPTISSLPPPKKKQTNKKQGGTLCEKNTEETKTHLHTITVFVCFAEVWCPFLLSFKAGGARGSGRVGRHTHTFEKINYLVFFF